MPKPLNGLHLLLLLAMLMVIHGLLVSAHIFFPLPDNVYFVAYALSKIAILVCSLVLTLYGCYTFPSNNRLRSAAAQKRNRLSHWLSTNNVLS